MVSARLEEPDIGLRDVHHELAIELGADLLAVRLPGDIDQVAGGLEEVDIVGPRFQCTGAEFVLPVLP
jgi:hypothetical protein